VKSSPAAGTVPVAPRLAAALAVAVLTLLAAVPAALAETHAGGVQYVERQLSPAPVPATAPLGNAVLAPDGKTAIAPVDAPPAVKAAIAAANRIVGKPYRYGGGHARFLDSGYDCSGTVSFALRGARLLTSPLPSSRFMSWGERGAGQWITVYAHGGHAYAVIAGLRLDTAGPGERGPRWRTQMRSTAGFVARHPFGL
jgi:cell wall-associated NlpC family hydrolase